MLTYAEKIANDASKVSEVDVQRLRSVGFVDQQICDVALCAAFRCFVSRFFDAVGADPRGRLCRQRRAIRKAMTAGKTY
jgi:UDP-glucose 4-epimerase